MSDILDDIIKRNINVHRDSLLPLLQEIQNELGYLSDESINRIGQLTGMPTSKIYGVATFYDQFRFNPKGRFHIRVCHGTACHVNESMNIIRELERILKIKQGQTTRDGMYSLEVVNCMGACAVAPVMNINGKYMPAAEVNKIKDIIEGFVSNSSVYENCQ